MPPAFLPARPNARSQAHALPRWRRKLIPCGLIPLATCHAERRVTYPSTPEARHAAAPPASACVASAPGPLHSSTSPSPDGARPAGRRSKCVCTAPRTPCMRDADGRRRAPLFPVTSHRVTFHDVGSLQKHSLNGAIEPPAGRRSCRWARLHLVRGSPLMWGNRGPGMAIGVRAQERLQPSPRRVPCSQQVLGGEGALFMGHTKSDCGLWVRTAERGNVKTSIRTRPPPNDVSGVGTGPGQGWIRSTPP